MSGCSDIVNMSIVDIVKCLVLTKIVSIHMKFTSTNQLILSLAKKTLKGTICVYGFVVELLVRV